MTDGKSHTYWQTTSQEKCETHYIIISLKENIKLTSLSIHTLGNKTDEFLKSVVIEVRAGYSSSSDLNSSTTSLPIIDNTILNKNGETLLAKCDYNLTLNNDYTLCTCFPAFDTNYNSNNETSSFSKNNNQINYIKLVFKRNTEKSYWGKNNDQIKIKSLKLVGKREVVSKRSDIISVEDASICWYFEMLSTMALMQSQLMPGLNSKILNITRF
jgi:hypothetical protein